MGTSLNEFHDYIVHDCLSHIHGITSKRMFGGYGIYQNYVIFALITSETELYFKVDEALKEKFKSHGSHPFIYTGHKNRKPTEMPYWLLPEAILEDKEKIIKWVSESVEAGRKTTKSAKSQPLS